jgi:hypothetical protein
LFSRSWRASQSEREVAQSFGGGVTAEQELEVGFPINARGADRLDGVQFGVGDEGRLRLETTAWWGDWHWLVLSGRGLKTPASSG